jgi:hypothetical protein
MDKYMHVDRSDLLVSIFFCLSALSGFSWCFVIGALRQNLH